MKDFLSKYFKVIFVILLFLNISFSFLYYFLKKNTKDLKVERDGEWLEPPVIINCNDSIYPIEDVEMVIENWETRGHQFLASIDNLDCHSENLPGFIQITIMSQNHFNDQSVGETKVSRDAETREIIGATITSLNPDYIVLEHEIGHALGYKHVEIMGHIMYPYYFEIGLDDRGLFIK